MEGLYQDLENYNDIDAVNRLKTENSDLKLKLEDCHRGMQRLQEEFDNLEAEFKRMEVNYSSLLKISRAEIQRKTEMITNLNIEKDLLVINAVQNQPAHKVQQFIQNVRVETEVRKKKHNKVGGQKGREELIRRRSNHRPSPATSTANTDNSNKTIGNERVPEPNKTVAQEHEPPNQEVFPGNRSTSPVVDKRVSTLSRHQLAKLSSDEEFEDMYSALKPKTTIEPEQNRKRGRDDFHNNKLYNSSHSRPHPGPFRERLNRKSGRFSDSERNVNREKQHNESDRYMKRGKQYNNDISRNVKDSNHQRFSPERHRRGAKELSDDRYRTRRLESPPREKQRFGSPQREKQQFSKIRERRKSYHGRDREHHDPDAHGHNYPETTIHGAYGEPQSKKPRIELNHVQQEEKRRSEKQDDKESHTTETRGDITSKSPEFSHTEESSNEAAESDVNCTASAVYVSEDPRRSSELYVKCSEDNGDALQCAHANKIHLQPVDKSLWNLQEVQVPKALKSQPAEISEEHVDKMDIDKAISIASLESGELGSETTDTALDDNYDSQEYNQHNYNIISTTNDRRIIKQTEHKENSPVDSYAPKDIRYRRSSLENEQKNTRLKLEKPEKAKHHRADKSSTPTFTDSRKSDTNANKKYDNTKMPSILQKLIHSMNENMPDRNDTDKVSKSRDENEPKTLTESRIPSKTDKASSKSNGDYGLEITNKSERGTEKNREKEKQENEIMLESKITNKLREETENNKEMELKGMVESKITHENEKAGRKTRLTIEPKKLTKKKVEKESKTIAEPRISLEKECLPSREVESAQVSELKTKEKLKNVTEDNVTIFRDFEHRVYSRHIVEGDLELSDESNDEAQLKVEEKYKEKKEITSRRISQKDTSKDKRVDSEDPTRKTRSQKDKEKDRKSINKFSELFGDSSSLITPEDLNLATRTAHGLPADCCPPAAEEAQDSIIETKTSHGTPATKVYHKSDFKDSLSKPTAAEEKYKTKESRTRTRPKQTKDLESEIETEKHSSEERNAVVTSTKTRSGSEESLLLLDDRIKKIQKAKISNNMRQNDIVEENYKPKESRSRTKYKHNKDLEAEINTHKESSEQINTEASKALVTCTKSRSESEESAVLLDDRIKKMQKAKICNDTQINDSQLKDKSRVSLNSNKRPKTKGEQKLSHSDNKEDMNTNIINNSSKPTPNNTLTMNDSKENTSRNGYSEGNISNEMSRIFEDTIVPSQMPSSEVSEVNKERPQLNDSTKETICNSVIQDVPNLASVTEEPGLVKMVVISTGIQPPDSTSVPYTTPFNALASSTPAKGLSDINISSEIDPPVSQSAQVSVTIARENSVPQPEADAPDIRITCYKRRRKVLKR